MENASQRIWFWFYKYVTVDFNNESIRHFQKDMDKIVKGIG
jgi:hypothetical protein